MTVRLGVILLAVVVAGCGGDDGGGVTTNDFPAAPAALRVTSTDFIHNGKLPTKYTCDGAGDEPTVFAGTVPASTSELVLLVDDKDAPGGSFVHLTRYGMSKRGNGELDEGVDGKNSAGSDGWAPACPPKGDGRHTYVWHVYALRDKSGLQPGADPKEVSAALAKADIVAQGAMSAFYSR